MIEIVLLTASISLGMGMGLFYRLRDAEKEIIRLRDELYLLSDKIESIKDCTK